MTQPRQRAATKPDGVLLRLLASLVLVGCTTVQAAREAQDPSRAVPGERTPSATEVGLPSQGPLDVERAVDVALRIHPSVLQATRKLDAAEARLGQAKSAYWPQVATGSTQVSRSGTHAEGRTTWETSTTLGLQVSWLVFDFGRTPALMQNAIEEVVAARMDLQRIELDVALAVRTAYYALEKQGELAVVAAETVTQFERRLELVEGFVAAGKRVRYDLTKAQADLASARLEELKARNAVEVAQATLANAIGLAEDVRWTIPDRPLAGFTLTLAQAWEQARERQPSLSVARAREATASALVDAQVAALFPALRLTASASAGGDGFPLATGLSAGPSLSWTIFDGFQNLYTIDEAAANLRAARAARAEEEQRVWLGLRSAHATLVSARERLDVASLGVTTAEQSLELARGRYEAGLATAVDLTDAQTGLAQARAELVQARADHDTSVAQMEKWIGSDPNPGEEP